MQRVGGGYCPGLKHTGRSPSRRCLVGLLPVGLTAVTRLLPGGVGREKVLAGRGAALPSAAATAAAAAAFILVTAWLWRLLLGLLGLR